MILPGQTLWCGPEVKMRSIIQVPYARLTAPSQRTKDGESKSEFVDLDDMRKVSAVIAERDDTARENQAQKQETASGDLPVAFSENEISVSFAHSRRASRYGLLAMRTPHSKNLNSHIKVRLAGLLVEQVPCHWWAKQQPKNRSEQFSAVADPLKNGNTINGSVKEMEATQNPNGSLATDNVKQGRRPSNLQPSLFGAPVTVQYRFQPLLQGTLPKRFHLV
jgi:hypothetical protein